MVVRQVQDLVPWLLGLRDASERTPDEKQRRSFGASAVHTIARLNPHLPHRTPADLSDSLPVAAFLRRISAPRRKKTSSQEQPWQP